jgi:L-lactate dehydrogenase complex protein LldG
MSTDSSGPDGNGARRRSTVFDRIRTGVSDGGTVSKRQAAVEARLAGQAPHLIPERAKTDAEGRKALFVAHLMGQSATVVSVAKAEDIPDAVAAYLRGANLAMRVRMGDDARLRGVPWAKQPALTCDRGRAQPGDEVGLSHAVAGVAETGTLVMMSGGDNPVTLNYLPETHIVVVKASDIAGSYEAAFDQVRGRLGRGTMTRTVNLISGPSRTGDIGGRLVMGAHGPRRMCVIIVDG